MENKEREARDMKESDNKVSIRCRRHKRRFEVDKEWLEKCSWLCPKCYEKLTAQERERYAPSKKKQGEEKLRDEGQTNSSAKERPVISYKRNEQKLEGLPFSNANINELLPRWRIKCKKCGKEVPVHKTYLVQTSSILCPECYFQMSADEVEKYHKANAQTEATAWEIEYKKETPVPYFKRESISGYRKYPKTADNADIVYGNEVSSERIKVMSLKELKTAVKKGRVSRIRARIEMKRRKKHEYYSSMPLVDPIVIKVR